MIFVVSIVAFGFFVKNSDADTYVDCISNANGNQTAINQCGSEFDN